MRLKCPECSLYALKMEGSDHWTCPECGHRIEIQTEETCQAVRAGEMAKEEFVVIDSCQDCLHFKCPMQPVDAEEKWMQDEMASMFGDDEEAQEAFEEGHAPDKD